MNLSLIPKPVRRVLSWGAFRAMDLRDLRRKEPRKIVWILGHMRSGSTLLMHLLGSHAQILGAGERNLRYESAVDLRKLEIVTFAARRKLWTDYDYVVDQINHGRFVPEPSLLDHPRIYRIFLVREPGPTLASMVQVLGKIYGLTVEQSAEYYRARLGELQNAACRAADPRRSFLVRYEDLLRDSPSTLAGLSSFLELDSPLGETYEIFEFTGKRGDPSERIQAGKIRRDLPPRHVDLPAAVRHELETLHQESVASLERSCFKPYP